MVASGFRWKTGCVSIMTDEEHELQKKREGVPGNFLARLLGKGCGLSACDLCTSLGKRKTANESLSLLLRITS